MQNKDQVWFITGANKGLGAAIAREALARGYKVVAGSRRRESAEEALGQFSDLLTVELDITNEVQVEDAVLAAVERFGRIDVLVNNAGYGLLGYFEEMSEEAIRRQFETNVFGTMKLTRAVLPVMRGQGGGFVVSVSSTSGIRAVGGGSVYSATKFALEGWSEGMNIDMAPFGIRFMLLEPGPFRTAFNDEKSSLALPDLRVEAYEEYRDDLAGFFRKMDGIQPGDPGRLAKALIDTVQSQHPPLRLLISKGVVPSIRQYYQSRLSEFEAWRHVSEASDFE